MPLFQCIWHPIIRFGIWVYSQAKKEGEIMRADGNKDYQAPAQPMRPIHISHWTAIVWTGFHFFTGLWLEEQQIEEEEDASGASLVIAWGHQRKVTRQGGAQPRLTGVLWAFLVMGFYWGWTPKEGFGLWMATDHMSKLWQSTNAELLANDL